VLNFIAFSPRHIFLDNLFLYYFKYLKIISPFVSLALLLLLINPDGKDWFSLRE